MTEANIHRAAAAIASAQALVITAGAGMGCDAGLPDYRSAGGFWRDYVPMKKLGLSDPTELGRWTRFRDDPRLLIGVWAHKAELFSRAVPHAGYHVLHRLASRLPHSIFTTNVDLLFEHTGFEAWRLAKCHGSLDRFQCSVPCSDATWEAPSIQYDPETFEASGDLPQCPHCGALARPNVNFFNDDAFVATPFMAAQLRHYEWLKARTAARTRMVVIECGAGEGLPVARDHSHGVMRMTGAELIRINLGEAGVPRGGIPLRMKAVDALLEIEAALPAQPSAPAPS